MTGGSARVSPFPDNHLQSPPSADQFRRRFPHSSSSNSLASTTSTAQHDNISGNVGPLDVDEKTAISDAKINNDLELGLPLAAAATAEVKGAAVDGKQANGARVSATHRGWLTVYKQLFALCAAVNAALFAAAVAGSWDYGKNHAALLSVANILAVVACRSEMVLRIIFAVAVTIFRRIPFVPPKVACTAVLANLGGVHSGCGFSSVLWLAYAVHNMYSGVDAAAVNKLHGAALAFKQLERASCASILGLLVTTCLAAFPALRHLHHNFFERVHRLVGWTALFLVWLFVVLSNATYQDDGSSVALHGSRLAAAPELWATSAITLLIILPWLSVRRVFVRTIVPSTSVSILRFPFCPPVRPGLLARISRSPLSEWHAFGTISDGVHGYVVVAGAVGDFTKALLSNPPEHLWVRTLHFAGIPYLTGMYDRVLHVATGSGICVFLSFLLQQHKEEKRSGGLLPSETEVHVIWVAKAVEKNYGAEFKLLLRRCSPERLTVYDTAEKGGRPDVGSVAVEKAADIGAQVVIVTSNPSGSSAVVSACDRHGIPAFGPVWDS